MSNLDFTDDEFLNLIDEVEAQGGEHLSGEHCRPHKFAIKQPNSKGDLRFKDLFTTGCGRESLFEVHPLDGRSAAVTVCATDDGMRLWPRFMDRLEIQR